jgi:hypothetical protein
VRRYLVALINGNESGAYAALGGSSGDRGLSLKEETFVDKDTRITSIRTTKSDASGATVEVEISSTRGTYFATYHVATGANGTIIDQHDYIKV